MQTGPQSGVITGQSQGGGAAQSLGSTSSAPDKASNFVGIKQYLDANKNQAAKLGDQTAGVINKSADEARQGLQTLNQAADNTIKGTESLGSDVSSKLANGAEGLSIDERNKIKATAAAQYNGPRDVTGLGDAYTNAAKSSNTANQNISNSGTEEGRMNLISQVNSKPRTQGMNVFDNTLLQAGGGREKLAQASAANADLKTGLDEASKAIQAKIGRADDPNTPEDESAGAIGQTNKAQADAYAQIQNAMNSWKSGFTPKVSQAQQAYTEKQQKVAQDLGDNPYGLDAETLALFGLNGGERIFDLDLNSYLTPGSPSDINAGNVASAEDYARYGALADLAGEQDLLLNPANASQAGKIPQVRADAERLKADIAARQAAFDLLASQTNLSSSATKGAGAAGDYRAEGQANLGDYVSRGDQALNVGGGSAAGDFDRYYSGGYSPAVSAKETADAEARNALAQQIQKWLSDQHYNQVVRRNNSGTITQG